jgi:hypothetical protein
MLFCGFINMLIINHLEGFESFNNEFRFGKRAIRWMYGLNGFHEMGTDFFLFLLNRRAFSKNPYPSRKIRSIHTSIRIIFFQNENFRCLFKKRNNTRPSSLKML